MFDVRILLAAVILAQAQPAASPVHIAGFVVDPLGNAVEGAAIAHAGRTIPITDEDGKFEVDTSAPAFVVRKPGFRSELVRIDGANVPRITIQKVKETMTFPTCSDGGLIGTKQWPGQFRFHKVSGVIAGSQSYYVETRRGRRGITQGTSSSSGFPRDADVWQSQKYDETVYVWKNETVIDARGEFSNGDRWRSLGKPGESAGYSDVDEATARILDRFLDGACLSPPH